ncbi:MAG: ABC transporter ATP-binding protein [Firmicutes bacterium]|jgi:putative ABC transport system ATP-binding protein|nr:ABC transporter ATP-binding protein [Bacillota bacterium]MDD3851716.1 ABC transporter ATP-binding protein [Bacillota bacterium]MDD4707043.1 ABC transporter ATP-binding protein [Bacillota bacterium]
MERVLISTKDLSKIYHMGEVSVEALRDANLDIYEGEFVVILGPSGSGKSTLLNIIGGMDTPTLGKVFFRDKELGDLDDNGLTRYRRENIGFIFQFYNLLPNLTARENLELVTDMSSDPLDVMEVLDKVGLKERADHFPSQLSGGEQQRVAVARAVAKNPEMLLCDEPTGALDNTTGRVVLKVLKEINQSLGKTVLVITHNAAIAEMANRVLYLSNGRIADIRTIENPVDPERIEW